MKHTGPTPDQPNRPAHVDITEDEATGDILDASYAEERLAELVKTSYEIAKSKGWHDKPRSFAAFTLLMQSEISEALEDYRVGRGLSEVWYEKSQKPVSDIRVKLSEPSGPEDKPCGIPVELADMIIRVADFCGHYRLKLYPASKSITEQKDFENALAESAACISDAYRDLSKIPKVADQWHTGSFGVSVAFSLSKAVQHLVSMCEANGIDLWKAIEIKTAFNRTRPMRHGGKLI